MRKIRSDVLDIARDCGADGECLEQIRLAVSRTTREAVSGSVADAHVQVQIELGDGELVVTVGGDGVDHAGARMRFPCTPAVDQEHDSAFERLEEALVEQDRLSDLLDAAVGTSMELTAYTQLQAAGNHVSARQAWVHWVADKAYRGLNAGAFELRASDGLSTQRNPASNRGAGPDRRKCDSASDRHRSGRVSRL